MKGLRHWEGKELPKVTWLLIVKWQSQALNSGSLRCLHPIRSFSKLAALTDYVAGQISCYTSAFS